MNKQNNEWFLKLIIQIVSTFVPVFAWDAFYNIGQLIYLYESSDFESQHFTEHFSPVFYALLYKAISRQMRSSSNLTGSVFV